jgi:cytochrome b
MVMRDQRQPGYGHDPRGAAASPPPGEAGDALRSVLVWDLPIRLFHWLIVVLIIAAYLTWRLNWMDWHARVGDALLALVLFRLLWGFFGSQTARFRHFVASPRKAARHLARIGRREPDHQVGHNPAGAWMVIMLLAMLLTQALTGLYVNNDVANDGPLTALSPAPVANALTGLHDIVLWDALLAAAALHVMGILVYRVAKGHNLVVPMITGCKRLPQRLPPPRMERSTRAFFCLVCAIVVAALLADWL